MECQSYKLYYFSFSTPPVEHINWTIGWLIVGQLAGQGRLTYMIEIGAEGRTVIVVGAGASQEFGLPVGSQLQDSIADIARYDFCGGGTRSIGFDPDLLAPAAGLSSFGFADAQRLKAKSKRIGEGVQLAASIDNYLHANKTDEELVRIGKLAIACCILRAESQSSLAIPDNGIGFAGVRLLKDLPPPHHSWIGALMKSLSAGSNFLSFCRALSSVTFVCFNYDRCIQRYIYESASLIYPADKFDIHELSKSLNIIHPYGSLGDLHPSGGAERTFGLTSDPRFLLDASSSIRTFTEGMESDVRSEIGDVLSGARRLIFLGYGFITTNDDFLFGESPFEIDLVLGSAYAISQERTEAISAKLRQTCLKMRTPNGWLDSTRRPQLHDETCSALLHRFSHLIETIGM